MNFMQKSILIILTLLLFLISISAVNSASFTNANTTEQIQGFINTGSDNELILDGQFNNLSTLQINRSIKISGENAIITKNLSSPTDTILFNISVGDVTIENLIIRDYGTAIQSNTGNLTINNNVIKTTGIAINIQNNTADLKDVIIKNNIISTTGTNSRGVYLYSIYGVVNNNKVYNNNIISDGYADHGVFLHSYNSTVNDNNIYNNTITTKGQSDHGIHLYSAYGIVKNNGVYNNIITSSGNYAFGVYSHSNSDAINNSVYNNTITTSGDGSFGIYFTSNSGNITLNSIYNNTITTKGDGTAFGIYLYIDSNSGNLTNNNVYNNTISTIGNDAVGIYLYINSNGAVMNNSFVSNDIVVNSAAIVIVAQSISGLNVSYNRILANDAFIYLSQFDNSNLFFANWLGNNTPDTSKIENIAMDSFYVVNATAIKNNGLVGEDWIINYTFYLNNTNPGEYWKLPFFMALLINTGGVVDNRIAYVSGNWNIPIAIDTIETFTIILDNEIIPLGTFTSENILPPKPVKNTSYISLSLNTKAGYIVGETGIVYWITQGINNLNQRAIIQLVENGKIWHTAYVLLSDGQYQHQFIMAHKKLDAIMTFLGDQDTYPCFNKVSTFVDPINQRRTSIEIINMNKLVVAKKGLINIVVRDYQGNPIKSGKVSLIFDKRWSFDLSIVDGIAKFSKTMLKAGDNRSLEIKYIASGDNSASQLSKNVIVDKGTPKISLTAKPDTTVVKDKVSLTTAISGVIFSSQKKWYNTIKFYNNKKLQYQVKIPIKVNSYSTGTSTLDYTFKKSHDNMTITSIFNGQPNYYDVPDSIGSIIVDKT